MRKRLNEIARSLERQSTLIRESKSSCIMQYIKILTRLYERVWRITYQVRGREKLSNIFVTNLPLARNQPTGGWPAGPKVCGPSLTKKKKNVANKSSESSLRGWIFDEINVRSARWMNFNDFWRHGTIHKLENEELRFANDLDFSAKTYLGFRDILHLYCNKNSWKVVANWKNGKKTFN